MTIEMLILLCAGLLIISFLYSAVGHAGASGYISIMGLIGLTSAFIRPVALILNILVAGITSWQFYLAGHFQWRTFWPYAVPAIPLAFLGGFLNIPAHFFDILLGIVLMFSAILLLLHIAASEDPHQPPRGISFGVGAGLGFIAGITGTGGGIFLTPILILCKWAKTKTASATSALFILVNSISGLFGVISRTNDFPPIRILIPLLLMVLIGGTAGSYLGSRKFPKSIVKILLACVLIIASIKHLIV